MSAQPHVFVNLTPLRDGVTLEEFERFSAELDQPLCAGLDVVERFDVFAVTDGAKATSPIHVVEVMQVRSEQEWERVHAATPEMEQVTKEYERLVDVDAVVTLGARRIPLRAS